MIIKYVSLSGSELVVLSQEWASTEVILLGSSFLASNDENTWISVWGLDLSLPGAYGYQWNLCSYFCVVWHWCMTFSRKDSKGVLCYIVASSRTNCDTAQWRSDLVLFVALFRVWRGVVLLMDMVCEIPFPLMVETCHLTSMRVNGTVLRDSGPFNRVDFFSWLSLKVSKEGPFRTKN